MVFSQKGELAERKTAMQNLGFVNDCGDKFTQVPEHFVTQISEAAGKIIFCVFAVAAQTLMVFVTLFSCLCAGLSSDSDDHEYDNLNKHHSGNSSDEE